MPSASLGHYAALSFAVIGRSEIINFAYWILDSLISYFSSL